MQYAPGNQTWRQTKTLRGLIIVNGLMKKSIGATCSYRIQSGKSRELVDWETVRSKYEDVTKMFLEKCPDSDKEKFHRRTEGSGSFNKKAQLISNACCCRSSPHIRL